MTETTNQTRTPERLFYVAVFEHPPSVYVPQRTYGVCCEESSEEHIKLRGLREKGHCVDITFFTRSSQKEAYELTDKIGEFLRIRKSKKPLTEKELEQFR